jgi:hypothetical protein
MFALGGEELCPGHHLGVLFEQGPTLTFGHASPDTEFDAVVQRIGAAFGDHWAMAANYGRLSLGGAADEQFVGVGLAAASLRNPRDAGFSFGALDHYTVDWGTRDCPARRGPYS